MKLTQKNKVFFPANLMLPAFLVLSPVVNALSFELTENSVLDWDTTLRYTAAQRVVDQDSILLSNVNGDDGNRAFDQYSLIKNRFDVITEADLNFGQTGFLYDFGAFARARAWYDDVYNQGHDHDSPSTSNNVSVPFNRFTDATRELQGKDAEMLDYFIYGGADIAGQTATLRVGSQALNWGETLFLLGGVATSQGPVDVTGFNQPGAELKELFMPVEQIALQATLTSNLSMEAYYQWEWKKHRLDAAGSYFQTADLIDEGGESLILGPNVAFLRGDDRQPSDSGQWGIAARYLAEGLAGTEFGFYYINYHDQLPQVTLDPANAEYYLDYAEDINLFAASFGSVIGSTNVSGEVTYRENTPVSVVDPSDPFAWGRAELMHYSLSAIHIFGANALMDNLNVTAEAAADQVLSFEGDELADDEFAWGYSMTIKPTWFEVAPALDVNLPISISQGVNGDSALGGSFTEGSHKVGVTIDMLYRKKYQAQIGYVNFFGGSKNNSKNDRDYVSAAFKYSF